MTGSLPMSPTVDAISAAALRDVILPDHEDYDRARRVWNGAIERYPAAIVRCADAADVLAAVRFAREHKLTIAVRAGGHNVAGTGTCDGGIVIDLAPMKDVRVDPRTRRAWAGPGLVWGELDRATQAFALAVPGGIVSSTGVAGFTLGGGLGWLHRSFGLAADNLMSANVITADGRLVRASANDNPDLLWGLRGGGGNFGIVTAFEFQLNPVGTWLTAGPIFYAARDLVPVARGFREITATAPDGLTLMLLLRRAPAAPFLPTALHGKPVVAIVGCYVGSVADGAKAMAPLADLAEPVANLVTVRQYTQFQSMLDGSWTPGFGNYWKAEYLAGIPDAALDVFAEHLDTITSPLSDFKVGMLGGVAGRVDPDATAFAHRSAPYVLNINSRWALPGDGEPHMAWTRSLWDAMRPFSAGGTYVNFLGDEGPDRVRAAYGEQTFARLVALKDAYDPRNVFRLNQNIPPS
jgi:FAD/FMN-containing dehydrogenase